MDDDLDLLPWSFDVERTWWDSLLLLAAFVSYSANRPVQDMEQATPQPREQQEKEVHVDDTKTVCLISTENTMDGKLVHDRSILDEDDIIDVSLFAIDFVLQRAEHQPIIYRFCLAELLKSISERACHVK